MMIFRRHQATSINNSSDALLIRTTQNNISSILLKFHPLRVTFSAPFTAAINEGNAPPAPSSKTFFPFTNSLCSSKNHAKHLPAFHNKCAHNECDPTKRILKVWGL